MFTMANAIQALNKPTLIIAHNKTLAAQLYSEFKEFFPENAAEESAKADVPLREVSARQLTDPKEIKALMMKKRYKKSL